MRFLFPAALVGVAAVLGATASAAAGVDARGRAALAGKWVPAAGNPEYACAHAREVHEFVFGGRAEKRLTFMDAENPAEAGRVRTDRILDVDHKGGLIVVTFPGGMTAYQQQDEGRLQIVTAQGPDLERANSSLELVRCQK